MLKLHTFGGGVVAYHDQHITEFVSQKAELLLIYLAINPYPHPREILADLLWSDTTTQQSLKNLRSVLANLQSLVGDNLSVTRQTLCINPESAYWVDVCEFEALLQATRQPPALGLPPESHIKQLEQAVALYRGDFLVGMRGSPQLDEWITVEQNRLRYQMSGALYQLVDYLGQRGHYLDALAYSQRLLHLDPYWEEAIRQQMRMLAYAGKRSEAIHLYEQFERLLADDMGLVPEIETTQVLDDIRGGRLHSRTVQQDTLHNLPLSSTSFVNRPREVAQIIDELRSDADKLVTLMGVGGVGKTRLALQVASMLLGDFAHGVYFVSLAQVNDANFVDDTILDALPVTKTQQKSLAQLLEVLQTQQLLLVLDNFEHVLEAAPVLSDILSHAPGVKILVTSRERLNLAEESIIMIDGFSVPLIDAPQAENASALKLFQQRAKQVQAEFTLKEHIHDVIEICRLVDGLPLGIELAAAWVRSMTPAQIAQNIQQSLDFLQTGLRNIPERHRGIRVLWDYTWESLNVDEQQHLMSLAVFRGGFAPEATWAVAGISLPHLMRFVEKSLIRTDGLGRFNMHELLRRYAFDKLVETGQLEHVQYAHAAYFAGFVKPEHRYKLLDNARFLLFDPEYDNLRAAMQWAFDTREMKLYYTLTDHLSAYWFSRNMTEEPVRWLLQAINADDIEKRTIERGKSLHHMMIVEQTLHNVEGAIKYGNAALTLYQYLEYSTGIAITSLPMIRLHMVQDKLDEAWFYAEQTLNAARIAEDAFYIANAIGNMGIIKSKKAEYAEAIPYLLESLDYFLEYDFPFNLTGVYTALAQTYLLMGDIEQAQFYNDKCVEQARKMDIPRVLAPKLRLKGDLLRMQERHQEALAVYQEGLVVIKDSKNEHRSAHVLRGMAVWANEQGQWQDAVLMHAYVRAVYEKWDIFLEVHEAMQENPSIESLQARLDPATFDALWVQGAALSVDEAVEIGLQLQFSRVMR